ncbi:MAG: hypothetical protein KKB51_14165 [Candidatus Riflebacteria bacterium]|nr:hypothetical protein [Candidatus Riflebacteria bacterium]
MNKKTCCGCFGGGCFLVVIALVVGSYFGYSFVHEKGVEFAASGLTDTVDKLTEVAFAEADREELNRIAAEVANDIRSGKIGLVEVVKETAQQLNSNLHSKAMLLAFYRKNFEQGELPESTEPVASAPKELVDRLILGMIKKAVSSEQTASLTAMLVERSTETIESNDGKSRITHSSRRLKKSLTPEDIAATLDIMRKICDDNQLPLPEADFNASDAVKNEIVSFFNKLKQLGTKE